MTPETIAIIFILITGVMVCTAFGIMAFVSIKDHLEDRKNGLL